MAGGEELAVYEQVEGDVAGSGPIYMEVGAGGAGAGGGGNTMELKQNEAYGATSAIVQN